MLSQYLDVLQPLFLLREVKEKSRLLRKRIGRSFPLYQNSGEGVLGNSPNKSKNKAMAGYVNRLTENSFIVW